MAEKELSNQDSLEIINRMIHHAKGDISEQEGRGWLLWGWMIFIASLATFISIKLNYVHLYLPWNIFGVLALLLLVFSMFRSGKRKKVVRTYVQELLRLFDIGFTICIFLIIICINVNRDPNTGFGYFLMVYGLMMLMQGGALRFRPLIIGAVVNFLGALAIFINQDLKYDMLITAFAVLVGYIIPGYLLRKRYKNQKQGATEPTNG